MARSIVFNGVDLSSWTTAEAVLVAAHGMAIDAVEVPGRAGATLLAARIPPKPIRVRLFLDLGEDTDEGGLAEVRHAIATALACSAGAELELPGEPGLAYCNVLCTDSSGWSALFEDGFCELGFTALDPVAWGDWAHVEAEADAGGDAAMSAQVGGAWRTWPHLTITSVAGQTVRVSLGSSGPYVEVEGPFSGGEEIVIDCAAGRVAVDGEAADASVALGSDFFYLEPGACVILCEGCSELACDFSERWP